jgi:hypothetical protein
MGNAETMHTIFIILIYICVVTGKDRHIPIITLNLSSCKWKTEHEFRVI